ncbi:hypothetical protein SEA_AUSTINTATIOUS_27 [Streptomyces phage Austintatious]|uniref:Uncharacterized protein n=1 Tax=Streptomyces phage Austintatious TaxID=2500795 RepID=A0A411AXF2_9CAUD|nr:hypothetical protein HOV10_gp27 [Streptomyces phage Austintatious]QAX92788.1 hypothetical protein SEA_AUSTINTATIOUS_27 [Streptomyces phage Austintatious]
MSTPMTAPRTAPQLRPVSTAEAGDVFRELQAAMDAAGFPTQGLYREERATQHGPMHVFGLGEVTVAGAKRMAAILRAARRQP